MISERVAFARAQCVPSPSGIKQLLGKTFWFDLLSLFLKGTYSNIENENFNYTGVVGMGCWPVSQQL